MTTTPVAPLGAAQDRADGPAKTRGQATFSGEYQLDGLVHAALVHAPIAAGTITAIDVTAAEACPGVIAVITHLNAPKLEKIPPRSMRNMASLTPGIRVNLLNTDTIHFDGQPVAVVVAETIDAAQDGASRVHVTYAQRPARADFDAALPDAKPLKNEILQERVVGRTGDVEAALAAAAVRVDLRFTTPEQNHNTLEPHTTTAVWEGDRVTVYDGCQAMNFTVLHISQRFGIPEANVRVVSKFVGGGFGSKSNVWPNTVLAAMAARVVDRPVRLVLTREGVYRTVGGRTASRQHIRLGADSTGRLTALAHTAVTRTGATGGLDEPVTNSSAETYAADNLAHSQASVELDLVPNTYMRAPGEAIGTFALESAVDQLAHELGQDPVQWRLDNLATATPIGNRDFSHRRLAECLRAGADLFDWARRPEPGSMADGDHLVGWGTGLAFHPAMLLNANVEVVLTSEGILQVRSGFHEMGMGAATAIRQIAAHLAGLPTERVVVDYGDTTLPTGPIAGGSAQTAALAQSLEKAIGKLTAELHSLARRAPDSPLRRTRRNEVTLRDGGLHTDTGGEPVTAILQRAGGPSIAARVGRDTGPGALAGQAGMVLRHLRDERKWSRAATGAHFCEVRIDRATGETRVSRWVSVFDIGRVVNHKTAASQVRGGIVMGLGLAMFEQTLIDPLRGRIMNPSLTEYHVPVHADVPELDVHFIDDPDPTMPLGIVGAGEVGITGVGGAVANAVFHATGRRITDLPITLDKVVG